jgi:hypothetical protein
MVSIEIGPLTLMRDAHVASVDIMRPNVVLDNSSGLPCPPQHVFRVLTLTRRSPNLSLATSSPPRCAVLILVSGQQKYHRKPLCAVYTDIHFRVDCIARSLALVHAVRG